MRENIKEFRAIKDGDQWCFVLPDFENLQVSESLWLPVYNVDMDYIFEKLCEIQEKRKVRND